MVSLGLTSTQKEGGPLPFTKFEDEGATYHWLSQLQAVLARVPDRACTCIHAYMHSEVLYDHESLLDLRESGYMSASYKPASS